MLKFMQREMIVIPDLQWEVINRKLEYIVPDAASGADTLVSIGGVQSIIPEWLQPQRQNRNEVRSHPRKLGSSR